MNNSEEKRRNKTDADKFIIAIRLSMVILIACLLLSLKIKYDNLLVQNEKDERLEQLEEQVKEEENEYIYIICDVVSSEYIDDSNKTVLDCVMPDGSVKTYSVYDDDVSPCEVCLKTDDQDNYECYKVVALR